MAVCRDGDRRVAREDAAGFMVKPLAIMVVRVSDSTPGCTSL